MEHKVNNYETRYLFVALNSAIFVLVLTGFGVNRGYRKSKLNQLCFKYAAKKCHFKNKDKARLICNTLITHNFRISAIKHHKECRKDL